MSNNPAACRWQEEWVSQIPAVTDIPLAKGKKYGIIAFKKHGRTQKST